MSWSIPVQFTARGVVVRGNSKRKKQVIHINSFIDILYCNVWRVWQGVCLFAFLHSRPDTNRILYSLYSIIILI